jgi:hypothetical protein
MPWHEHEHREKDYSAEFIRAVKLLCETRAPRAKEPNVTDKQAMPLTNKVEKVSSIKRATRQSGVHVRFRC